MERIIRSLNYDLQFDKDAQHILENSHTDHTSANTITLTSTPTITSLDSSAVPVNSHHITTTSDFLSKLGASIINSIQLQTSPLNLPSASAVSSSPVINTDNMDFTNFQTPHHVVIDSVHYDSAMDELQKQVEYDQFMNEVWIGIVLILILISMVFCFCSCFLYHQFRVWKRNYRHTMTQSDDEDNVKINLDFEDPVPEYTLVSGLPSYEAALELLHKNPQSCLIVHPSVFEVFNCNEKSQNPEMSMAAGNPTTQPPTPTTEVVVAAESSTPLLADNANNNSKTPQAFVITPLVTSSATAVMTTPPPTSSPPHYSLTSLSLVNEKLPGLKTQSSTDKTSSSTKTSDKPEKS
ncbi:protein commissureless 2 [Musca vetustissima]|uniref:protein commissureless 2 n=1 Tax=Musca vetustissima TaxID=27455 RepID=UPI002AB5DEAC|nr:protein commissureless 2 [Musca vetustissima]